MKQNLALNIMKSSNGCSRCEQQIMPSKSDFMLYCFCFQACFQAFIYTYMSCFVDSYDRVLSDDFTYIDGMEPAKCMAHCHSRGFEYSGVQYGKECYCGAGLPCPFTRADESDCNMPCQGDADQMCAGGFRNSVYTTTSIVKPQGKLNCNRSTWY